MNKSDVKKVYFYDYCLSKLMTKWHLMHFPNHMAKYDNGLNYHQIVSMITMNKNTYSKREKQYTAIGLAI